MSNKFYFTLDEIRTQPHAWAQAIEVATNEMKKFQDLWQRDYGQVLIIGCGSTYYLSLAAASTLQSLSKRPCRAFPSSEILLSPASVFAAGKQETLLFAISRSGTTTETVRAVQQFKDHSYGGVVTITNYSDSPIARLGDLSLVIPAGQEKSVAQTRSFASLFVAICTLGSFTSQDPNLFEHLASLPEIGERVIKKYADLSAELGSDHTISKYFFLGSGYRYGLACEASLKLKEMSLSLSEPFHSMEFRHGPMSMVDASTLAIGLLGEASRVYEEAVIEDIRKIGGRTLTLAESNAEIAFESRIPELLRGVLYLPALQMLAYHCAVSRGLNPDKPRNLTAVVTLDL